VNHKDSLSSHYEKYLQEQLRVAFGYEGCPIFLHARERPKKVSSVRTSRRKFVEKKKQQRNSEPGFRGPQGKTQGRKESTPKSKRLTKQARKAREGQRKKK